MSCFLWGITTLPLQVCVCFELWNALSSQSPTFCPSKGHCWANRHLKTENRVPIVKRSAKSDIHWLIAATEIFTAASKIAMGERKLSFIEPLFWRGENVPFCNQARGTLITRGWTWHNVSEAGNHVRDYIPTIKTATGDNYHTSALST